MDSLVSSNLYLSCDHLQADLMKSIEKLCEDVSSVLADAGNSLLITSPTSCSQFMSALRQLNKQSTCNGKLEQLQRLIAVAKNVDILPERNGMFSIS